MAEGRMLKKNISDSRRLAELKTDSARMLWTWMLPHLDIEGRMHASPDMIKGKVVPRIKTMTEPKIEEYLHDMARVGLICLYDADGDRYLQWRKFHDFQSLRPGKEAESRIPCPTTEQLQDNSSTTPGVVQDKSGVSKDKIREDKIIYSEVVLLKKKEYEKLVEQFGDAKTTKAIQILANYIQSKGAKYKSHYHTLIGWPMKRVQEESGNGQQPASHRTTPYKPCPSCGKEVLPEDIDGNHCIHCAPRKPLSEILDKIGKRI